MTSVKQNFTWRAPDQVDFETQWNEFLASTKSTILQELFVNGWTDDEAVQVPLVAKSDDDTSANLRSLKGLILSAMSLLRTSLQNARSSDTIRAPALSHVFNLIKERQYTMDDLRSCKRVIQSCFQGSLMMHMIQTKAKLLSIRYDPVQGINAFLNHLDDGVTRYEALSFQYERKPFTMQLVDVMPQLYTMPSQAVQVLNAFVAPIDDVNKTRVEDVEHISFPNVAQAIRNGVGADLLNPRSSDLAASSAAEPVASATASLLPTVNSTSAGVTKCAFHGSTGHSLRDCRHYLAYLKEGNPKIGHPQFAAALAKWKKANSSPRAAKSFGTNSIFIPNSPPGVSVNSSGNVAVKEHSKRVFRFGLDTHTTHHVVEDRSLLDNLVIFEQPKAVFNLNAEAREGIAIIGEGNLKLRFSPPGTSPYEVTFTGVLLAESTNQT